jgi:hypothetical protein
MIPEDEIEVVARAIAISHDVRDWELLPPYAKDWWRKAAQAAIAALDEYRWAKVDQRLAEDRAHVKAPYIRDPSA